MSALEQFVGATATLVRLVDDEVFVIEFLLPDGSGRTLIVYNAHGEPLSVRIDGLFVPSEEL